MSLFQPQYWCGKCKNETDAYYSLPHTEEDEDFGPNAHMYEKDRGNKNIGVKIRKLRKVSKILIGFSQRVIQVV